MVGGEKFLRTASYKIMQLNNKNIQQGLGKFGEIHNATIGGAIKT